MNLKHKLLKQKKIGSWWGGVKQSTAQLTMYVTFINLLLIAVTAWNTTLSEWLAEFGIEIPFIVFALGILFILMAALLFEYKVSIPSFFSFWSAQFWEHDNPMRKKIEEIDKKLDELIKPKWDLVQTQNPVSKRWVLINKVTGSILTYSEEQIVGVPLVRKDR